MVTLAQRIEELRTERGLNRPRLSAALGLPKNAVEKFETGRQTPTQEQQAKMADFFGVSLFYLRGESNDRTRQETWMDAGYAEEEPAPAPRRPAPKPQSGKPREKQEEGSLVEPFLRNPAFQSLVRSTVLEVLRSPEGQEILARVVRRELDHRG